MSKQHDDDWYKSKLSQHFAEQYPNRAIVMWQPGREELNKNPIAILRTGDVVYASFYSQGKYDRATHTAWMRSETGEVACITYIPY